MNYLDLENYIHNKKVCIWGFGGLGKTIALATMRCVVEDDIVFCDNKYRCPGYYDGIKLIAPNELFENAEDYVVAISVSDEESQNSIKRQLYDNKVKDIFVFDRDEFNELCESIEHSNDEVKARYEAIFDDKLYLSMLFMHRFGKQIDFNNPKTFNEKLQWLKVYDRKSEYVQMVDKYLGKKYISSKIGNEYVIPIIGSWDTFAEIDIRNLPEKFVLKCTHDSGSVVICNNQEEFDFTLAQKRINKALSTNYFWGGREWPYKKIKPRIICEEYKVDESGEELKDYKVFCFEGIPQYIQVDFNRHTRHERNLYSKEWKYMGFTSLYPTNPRKVIEKPLRLEEMLQIASVLSSNMHHARVDFYVTNDSLYVGEITLYHGSGFEKYTPEEWDYRLGELITI